jgi:hypothetical protein
LTALANLFARAIFILSDVHFENLVVLLKILFIALLVMLEEINCSKPFKNWIKKFLPHFYTFFVSVNLATINFHFCELKKTQQFLNNYF